MPAPDDETKNLCSPDDETKDLCSPDDETNDEENICSDPLSNRSDEKYELAKH